MPPLAIADALGGVEGIALGATNLAVLLDRVGRTADALAVSETGWERVRSLGVERTYGGLLLAIAAKAAIALGRWDEADTFLRLGLDRDPVGTTGVRLRIQRGRLDTYRGDLAAAAGALAAARTADEAAAGGADGAGDDRPALLAALADLAAAGGRLTDARAAVSEGLTMARNGPPDPALVELAATGLRAEADAAAAAREGATTWPRRTHGREVAHRPRGRAGRGLPRAPAKSVGRRDRVGRRDGAVARWSADRPLPCRGAEARGARRTGRLAGGRGGVRRGRPSVSGGLRPVPRRRRGPARARPAPRRGRCRSRAAHDAASALGARPLVAEIASLAREARLDLRRHRYRLPRLGSPAGRRRTLT